MKDVPRDWLVWHFTHESNLSSMVSLGCLCSPALKVPATNVANQEVKARRDSIPVYPDPGYPPNKVVSDHVPFYIAAKSPMLYAVTKGHMDYHGGADPLVFLGASIGAIVDSGLTWCVSDANAATNYVRFTRDLNGLGDFVDFHLLCQRMWSKTPDDQYRPGRRAAEVLVLDRVPLELITNVIAKTQVTLGRVRAALGSVGGSRHYQVEPTFYYD